LYFEKSKKLILNHYVIQFSTNGNLITRATVNLITNNTLL
jgi:hypothetical protein